MEIEERILGDAYLFRVDGVEVEMTRFTEDRRDGLKAEVEVRSLIPPRGIIHQARLNLTSTESRARFVRACVERVSEDWHGDTDFRAIIEACCIRALERWRRGEPPKDLLSVPLRERPRWKLRPFLENGGPTVLFAYGESGKSLLALAMAVDMASCAGLVGESMEPPCPVLMLDWEADEYAHAERLRAILAGAGVSLVAPIYYQRMSSSLAEAAATLSREIARLNVGAVIIDSMGMARSGEAKDAGPTIDVFRAIRTLRVPALVLDHLPKDGDGDNPYGSIYTTNLARITWRLEALKTEEGHRVLLVNKKSNNAGRLPRVGLDLQFETEPETDLLRSVTIRHIDASTIAAMLSTAPLTDRILGVLRNGGPMAPAEIAEELALDERERKQLYPRLRELVQRGKLVQRDKTYAVASQ